jgi:hypothetical protein
MALKRIKKISEMMCEIYPADLPCAVISKACWTESHSVLGTIGTIARIVETKAVEGPAIWVVGHCVGVLRKDELESVMSELTVAQVTETVATKEVEADTKTSTNGGAVAEEVSAESTPQSSKITLCEEDNRISTDTLISDDFAKLSSQYQIANEFASACVGQYKTGTLTVDTHESVAAEFDKVSQYHVANQFSSKF